jgi:hypothetical protein
MTSQRRRTSAAITPAAITPYWNTFVLRRAGAGLPGTGETSEDLSARRRS